MGSRRVKRIVDVSRLRNYQFPQDVGLMAHLVWAHSYIKMEKFYTVTVYEKECRFFQLDLEALLQIL